MEYPSKVAGAKLFLILLLQLHFPALITGADHYSRADFPQGFVFGSGTSAAQYEGAAFLDGRTASIWDTFAHSGAKPNGDVACDGYHKYKQDIKLMVDMGLEAFRISISWSRLIPQGRGAVNPKGLEYYNNLFNELISNGIQPHVTLCHIDLPQVLEDEYGGWLSRKIVKDFVEFADACFREFGDRVMHWTTLNEINIVALGGYDEGGSPPGRCSTRSICAAGDSTREPYTVVHNMLLSHSAVAKLYRDKYKATQNGKVGINIYSVWFEPRTNSTEDVTATERAKSFYIGWVLNPVIYGDYPDALKKQAQKRIPSFSKQESEQLKGSSDFVGINNYFKMAIRNRSSKKKDVQDFFADMGVDFIRKWNSTPEEYPVDPDSLGGTLGYIKEAYGNPPVYVHENGKKMRRNVTLNDTSRVEYLQAYIGATLDEIRKGSNVKGYFAWSFMDCLEVLDGYDSSFGFFYVDLDDTELTRYRKLSAGWYSNFIRGGDRSVFGQTQLLNSGTVGSL